MAKTAKVNKQAFDTVLKKLVSSSGVKQSQVQVGPKKPAKVIEPTR